MTDLQPGGSGAGSTVETPEPMPTGVIHDPGCCCWPHIEASAVAQLRADLAQAQSESRRLTECWDAEQETHRQTFADLAQARARMAKLEAAIADMMRAGSNGSAAFDQAARRIRQEVFDPYAPLPS